MEIKKERKPSAWAIALKKWNSTHSCYSIPKKESEEWKKANPPTHLPTNKIDKKKMLRPALLHPNSFVLIVTSPSIRFLPK